MRFKPKPYEQCISNKLIDEHQFTIGKFVDNNKVSHTDDNVNSIIANKIEKKIGNLYHKTVKKRRLLGMEIEFIGGKKVAVSMPHHVDEALKYFGETLKGNVANPTTSQLFTIISKEKELDD